MHVSGWVEPGLEKVMRFNGGTCVSQIGCAIWYNCFEKKAKLRGMYGGKKRLEEPQKAWPVHVKRRGEAGAVRQQQLWHSSR